MLPEIRATGYVLKRFLAYLETIRQQRWISLDFPDSRISASERRSRAIAMEDTGRTTAIELGRLEGLGAPPPEVQRFLARRASDRRRLVVARTGTPGRRGRVGRSRAFGGRSEARGRLDTGLVRSPRRRRCPWDLRPTWISVGRSSVCTCSVEKLHCPGDLGGLRILHADPPQYFETVVHDHLERRLGKLDVGVGRSPRAVVRKQRWSWSAGQLRAELRGSVEFADLNRVDEIWIADTAQRRGVGQISACDRQFSGMRRSARGDPFCARGIHCSVSGAILPLLRRMR